MIFKPSIAGLATSGAAGGLKTVFSRRIRTSDLRFGTVRSLTSQQSTTAEDASQITNPETTSTSTTLRRYGLGGQHWRQFDPSSYQNLIFNALTHKPHQVDYFEVAGPDGGEIAMVGAIQSAIERLEQNDILSKSVLNPITITTRIGYRSPSTIGSESSSSEEETLSPQLSPLSGDVILTSPDDPSSTSKSGVTHNMPSNIVHNIHPQYVVDTIQSSTLWELQDVLKEKCRLVFLLHNPEAQIVDLLRQDPNATHGDRQEFLKTRMTPVMDALQEFCRKASESTFGSSSGVSFGVVSNGLSIPPENNHPMQIDKELIVESVQTYDKFSTVHLPANLLETHGWDVARSIKSSIASLPDINHDIEVAAIRPLSAYPDLGTGDSYPFRLVDYSLPSLEQQQSNNETTTTPPTPQQEHQQDHLALGACYTNEMSGIPIVYQMALQAAMSHFDAEPLLEIKLERDLTTEERETLDGCKLVQSMIHDLDTQLQDIRSFAQHEDELYGRIIPLLYDTFEAMDDQTSDVLQAYFAAYAVAVRYAIAQKTRSLLKDGEKTSKEVKQGMDNSGITATYPDIPQHMTLQEYALRRMLSEEACFDRIIMGASTIQDFEHQSHLMEMIHSEDGNPMDCIVQESTEEDKD